MIAPRQTVITHQMKEERFYPPSPDIYFDGAEAVGVDFSDIDCWRFMSSGTTFAGCIFDRARIRHGPLSLYPPSLFSECRFDGVDFRGVDPGHARFEGCIFTDVRIQDWFAYCAEFVRCSFSGTIRASRFSAKPIECAYFLRRRLTFTGNDFADATLIDTEFTNGIDLDAQVLPSGEDYIRIDSAKERIATARSIAAEWPNKKARDEVLISLDALAPTADDQVSLFLRRDLFEDMASDLREEMWRLLESPPHSLLRG